jgi:ribonuclease Z
VIATLHILGTGSAVPTSSRFPSAQVLDFGGDLMLIDCGEGCQMQMRKQKIGFGRLRYIFISHAHGDHFFGLIGLLSTLSVLKANQSLDIFAPRAVTDMIRYQMEQLGYNLRVNINWHILKEGFEGILLEKKNTIVETFPLHHSIPVHGFVFREKVTQKNIDRDKIEKYQLSIPEIVAAKKGEDIIRKESIIANEAVTLPLHNPLKYVYCTDTTPVKLHPMVENAHLLYHEATFAEKDRGLSEKTFHSTATDAARSASENKVQHLLIGHFSGRYRKPDILEHEAQKIFPATTPAKEGLRIRIDSKENTIQILPAKKLK